MYINIHLGYILTPLACRRVRTQFFGLYV